DPIYDAKDDRLMKPAAVADASRLEVEEIASRFSSLFRGGDMFTRLRHSGAEVRAIAETLHVDANALHLGAQASGAAVKSASQNGELAKARYVHFASHGILGQGQGQQ